MNRGTGLFWLIFATSAILLAHGFVFGFTQDVVMLIIASNILLSILFIAEKFFSRVKVEYSDMLGVVEKLRLEVKELKSKQDALFKVGEDAKKIMQTANLNTGFYTPRNKA